LPPHDKRLDKPCRRKLRQKAVEADIGIGAFLLLGKRLRHRKAHPVEALVMRKGSVSFRYKSAGVHTCLCRAGLLLELKIYLSAPCRK